MNNAAPEGEELARGVLTPVISFVGKSDSGKTTFLEKLIPELKRRGFRVGVVKHDTHGFEIDRPGKDSHRLKSAGADVVLISSPWKLAMVKDVAGDTPLEPLVGGFMGGVDLVLTEGYKKDRAMKIEVSRRETSNELLCGAGECIAVVADWMPSAAGAPVFALDDVAGVADFILRRAGLNVRRSSGGAGGAGARARRPHRKRGWEPMISVDEALRIVLENVPRLGVEEVDLLNCVGRVLAEDCAADVDIPLVASSAMDGYAVCSAFVEKAREDDPVRLKTIGSVPAGRSMERGIAEGEAARVMTGAPIPPGADAVVMIEYTEAGEGTVAVKRPVKPGENVRPAGEDVRAGSAVLRAGRRLTPADAGMLASCGRTAVRVSRKPVVGIISTGDEVVLPGEPVRPGLVRNSNSYTLFGLVLEAGGEPVFYGTLPDVEERLLGAFREAAARCDAVLTAGGVSVGDYDLVRDVLAGSGDVLFRKVLMKPGKTTTMAYFDGVPFFGLPGYPVSCMIAFELFVRPALARMTGCSETGWKKAKAVMEEDFRPGDGRRNFIRGVYRFENERLFVRSTGSQGFGVLSSMVLANCLIIVPEGAHPVRSADLVDVILLR
ncbi:MAG: gephyrin-like molybdotransferase Glp [bacterium]